LAFYAKVDAHWQTLREAFPAFIAWEELRQMNHKAHIAARALVPTTTTHVPSNPITIATTYNSSSPYVPTPCLSPVSNSVTKSDE